MTPEDIIFPFLDTLGVTAFAVTASTDAPRPHIIFRRTQTQPVYNLVAARVAQRSEVRVDCYCRTIDELRDLMLDVMDAVELHLVDQGDDPAAHHGWLIFSCWSA